MEKGSNCGMVDLSSKMKYLILSIIFIGSCDPAKLVITDTDTAPVVEDRSWVTWDECGQSVGENPCNFTLLDQNGDEVELYDYHGKVIVIDFSTMWCGVCVNIAAEGDNLVAKYGEDNVIWLTVLIDNEYGDPPTQEDIQRWVDMANIKIPVLAGDRSMIDSSAKTGYPIASWPTLVVIDKEMVLRHGISGWNSAAIDTWVNGLL